MKYYISIKPKDKPNGLYLLNSIGTKGVYTTTEKIENAMCFQSKRYNGLDPEHFAFLLFDLIGFESNFNDNNELVSDFIIRLISEKEIAQMQELATWKSTLVELPRNGECIAFRFAESLDVVRKGYIVVCRDKSTQFTEITMGNVGEFLPDNHYIRKSSTEVFWKPLMY